MVEFYSFEKKYSVDVLKDQSAEQNAGLYAAIWLLWYCKLLQLAARKHLSTKNHISNV